MADYNLKGWLVNFSVTTDDTTDQILLLEPSGHVTHDKLIKLLKEEDSGLRIEAIEHVVNLLNRVTIRYVLNGFSVDTGLVRLVAQPKGLIKDMTWNPQKNYVHVTIVADKELREEMGKTNVHILGEKGDAMFIGSGLDAETRASNGSATAGSAYTLHGRMLKIEGTDPAVGLTLTNHATGQVTQVTGGKISLNVPSRISFYIPDILPDGDYSVTVTTQYTGKKTLRKDPRTATWDITVGRTIGTLPVEPELPGQGDGGGGIYIDPNA
jgi:hypothetical protein